MLTEPGIIGLSLFLLQLGLDVYKRQLKKRSTAILAHLGLLSYLDIPVFADDVIKLKPYPDLYLEVLRRAQVPCEHAVAFEDSLTGVQAAIAAGIQTVRIPDYRFIDRCV